MSYASDSHSETIPKTSVSYHDSLGGMGDKTLSTEIESARPQTVGEEELQLQLALAMSKEEAEAEEKLRKTDDIRLQLAITESQRRAAAEGKKPSAVDDLLSLNTSLGGATGGSDPWGTPMNGASSSLVGAVGGAASPLASISDPWSSNEVPPVNDPWNPTPARSSSATNDPWQPSPPTIQSNSNVNEAVNDPWSTDVKTGMFHFPFIFIACFVIQIVLFFVFYSY